MVLKIVYFNETWLDKNLVPEFSTRLVKGKTTTK